MPESNSLVEPPMIPAVRGQCWDALNIENWQFYAKRYRDIRAELLGGRQCMWAKQSPSVNRVANGEWRGLLVSQVSACDGPGPLHTPPWATHVVIFSRDWTERNPLPCQNQPSI